MKQEVNQTSDPINEVKPEVNVRTRSCQYLKLIVVCLRMLFHHVTLHIVFPVVKLPTKLTSEVLDFHVDSFPVPLEVALPLRQTPDKLGGAVRAFPVVISRVEVRFWDGAGVRRKFEGLLVLEI